MNFKQNEEAVSPVIGVILMVAITVILAAVIAAFVFGMTGNVQTQKTVAVTASQQGTGITLTFQGGPDANDVEAFTWSVDNEPATGVLGTTVGSTITEADVGDENKNHVVVTAEFKDGSFQVVLDTYV